MSTKKTLTPATVDNVDSRYLESLLGYNARRAALTVIDLFMERMAPHDLRPVDFSVLSLIRNNPGITSRQLCTALDILPPNLVGMISTFEKRNLVRRQPHPLDGRAMALFLTDDGEARMALAEPTVTQLEAEVAARLTPAEFQNLLHLLQKIYLPSELAPRKR